MSYQALLFCPDEKTARLVTQILGDLEFIVETCNEPFGAVKKLMAQRFDAVVVDCDNEQNAGLIFKSARNSSTNQSSLAVAVVEGQAGVAKAFRIGANLVLTKPINVEQSKATLRVARGLLRKGDVNKSAATTVSADEQRALPSDPARPASVSPAPIPPKAASFKPTAPPQAAVAPAVASTAFELDAEPGLRPEPAEASLIESMSKPATREGHPSPAAASSASSAPKEKEYAWQPTAKPLAEPMASAMRKAAEAAGKTQPISTATAAPAASVEVKEKSKIRPITGGLYSNKGAATGTAAAREADDALFEPPSSVSSMATAIPEVDRRGAESEAQEAAAVQPTHLDVEPPTFSMGGSNEEAAGGGSKKPLLVAAVLLLAAGAGYYGWTTMHGSHASTQQNAPIVAAASPTNAPAPVDRVPSTAHETAVAPLDEAPPAAAVADPTPAPAKTPSKASTASTPTTAKSVSSAAPAAIIVKKSSPLNTAAKAAAEEVAAPPAAAISGNGTSANALSGIVATSSTRIPTASPQSVKLSQGVSEGLLIKKVAPVYPMQAVQMRIQGAVMLQASIGKDGSITKVKAMNGDGLLSRAAADAVKQWKYKPYLLNGEPVEIQTQVTVVFKLP